MDGLECILEQVFLQNVCGFISEIKVFRCGVKIMRACEWSGQDPIIRNRNNNICISECILS